MDKLPVTLYASLVEWINKFSKNAKVGRYDAVNVVEYQSLI